MPSNIGKGNMNISYIFFNKGVKLTWKTFQTSVKICQTEADTATPEFLFFLPQHQVHNQVYIKNHQNCTFQIYKRHTSCTKNQSTESSKMKQQFIYSENSMGSLKILENCFRMT